MSLPRSVPTSRLPLFASVACLLAIYWIVARSCGYDHRAILSYAAYLAAYVWLPGLVTLRWVRGRPLGPVDAIALALPTGYALEVLGYIGLSLAHAGACIPWLPVPWLALGAWLARRDRAWPLTGIRSRGAALATAALAAIVVLGVLSAASEMFADAPLAQGLPSRPTFIDWVYLVSRSATIKNHWPFEDPSLSGSALQYHYFLLVHAAGAARVTGDELTMLMLRLVVVPLNGLIVVQAYALGRRLNGCRWSGVLAGALTLLAGEVSDAGDWMHPRFLGLFSRWLYQSPTFFFGLIFFGALILAIHDCIERRHLRARDLVWLLVLAAGATGAKGTVVPELLVAFATLATWLSLRRRIPSRWLSAPVAVGAGIALFYASMMLFRWGTGVREAGGGAWARALALVLLGIGKKRTMIPFLLLVAAAGGGFWAVRRRYLPLRWALIAGVLAVGFAGIYVPAMAGCGTGDAAWQPLFIMTRAQFWKDHFDVWRQAVAAAVPSGDLSTVLAVLCSGVIVVGTVGIRILSVPYFFRPRRGAAVLAAWLGAVMATCIWMGALLHLDCDSELYLLLPMRLPMSVLAAAFIVELVAEGRRQYLIAAANGTRLRLMRRRWLLAGTLVTTVAVLAAQLNRMCLQNWSGLVRWVERGNVPVDVDFALLRDGMTWIRAHTEPDAVLIANAFTSDVADRSLDGTPVGQYYYYSALSERRLWVEGPVYLQRDRLDEAHHRMREARRIFANGVAASHATDLPARSYLLVDRLVGLPSPKLKLLRPVYENARIAVYREAVGAEFAKN